MDPWGFSFVLKGPYVRQAFATENKNAGNARQLDCQEKEKTMLTFVL